MEKQITQHHSLCGTRSKLLNAGARLFSSLTRQGLARTAGEVVRRAQYAVAMRRRRFSQSSPDLPSLARCTWINMRTDVIRSEITIDPNRFLGFLEKMRYPRFYYRQSRRLQYALWHFAGLEIAQLRSSDIVLDVGAQCGIWGSLARRQAGCRVIDLDHSYRPGVHRDRIGAPVGRVPLPDGSITCMASFCAFNCLEGEADILLLKDAERLLALGGRLVIVPLCIADEHVNLFDPLICKDERSFDATARRVAWNGWGNNFGRWYDEAAFNQRVLANCQSLRTTVFDVLCPSFRTNLPRHFFACRFQRLVAPSPA